MRINPTSPGSGGIALLCGSEGRVLEILSDGLGVADRFPAGYLFSSGLDPGGLARSLDFLREIRAHQAAFDWEFQIAAGKGSAPKLRFNGCLAGHQLLILGAASTVANLPSVAASPYPPGTLPIGPAGLIDDTWDELSRLNNELANLQRDLAKQNFELKKLKDEALASRDRAERANQTLRESEAQFRCLVEGAPDAIFINSEYLFSYLNAAACRLFGADSPAQLLHRPVMDRIHPSGHEIVKQRIHKLLDRSDVAPLIEQTWLRLDGQTIPVEVATVPIVHKGKPAVLVFARDISDRKHAETARSASEQRYRTAVDSVPDPVVVLDRAMHITLVNAEAERVFGYRRAELMGQPASLLIPKRFHAAHRGYEEAYFAEPSLRSMVMCREGSAVRKDGVEIPVEIRIAPTAPVDKEAEIMVVIRDLSDMKQAEQKFRKFMEAAPDALLVVNGEGDIVLVNAQVERMFGYPRNVLLQRKINLLFPEGALQRNSLYYAVYSGRHSGLGAATELIGLRRDGTEFPIEVGASRMETDEGMFVFGAIRDITERKDEEKRSRRLEIMAAEAQAANRAKSVFLSTMSHEIRTPMNAILGYSQLMLRDPSLGNDALANLRIVCRSGEHLLALINDVLDMSRIEAGRTEFNPVTFNIARLLDDLASMFRLRAEAKGLRLEMRVDGEAVPYVVGDAGKIRQVLTNLLGNAVKFTEAGRIALLIALEQRPDGRLWLSARVEDTGVGIAEGEHERLFEPFSQAKRGVNIQEGTGLGLAISRKHARLMGGDVTVTSRPGIGSVFRFEIPIERGNARAVVKQIAPRRVTGIQTGQAVPKVLVVDDHPDNRDWLMKLLGTVGFSTRGAENGEAAIRDWKEWNPRLVLMDMHMPVLDGLQATRRIKADPRGKETVVVALTASALEEDRRSVFESGADDFLAKPCLEAELLEKIRLLLNIEYDYEEISATEPAVDAKSLSAERLAQIPRELIEEIRSATLRGAKKRLDSLIVRVGETGDAETARGLQALADRYEYDALTRLLEQACRQV